jgi:hypothetical protein
MHDKRWNVAPPLPESARAALAAYPPVVAQALYNRTLTTQAEAERFFSGHLTHEATRCA